MNILNSIPATNFVFLGEAGCGKSEIAVNLALQLSSAGEKSVHFYDLDMTKPIFRSRDVSETLLRGGVEMHYEEQFMDAPTINGGVMTLLKDESVYTVLDVGGDYIGARSVGGYAPQLNRDNTAIFYVVNPYRPWSLDMEHIDGVLSEVLGVSHVELSRLIFVGNPNLGPQTTAEDVRQGVKRLQETVGQYAPIAFSCAEESLSLELAGEMELYPLKLYMGYPWNEE